MKLTPEYIKEHLKEIGVREASKLLEEWIVNSNDAELRIKALNLLGTFDSGKNFRFFEQLFLSDEDINIRIISGKILKEKYSDNKNIGPLLEFTLEKIDNIEQKYLAAKLLNSINSKEYQTLIKNYLINSIKSQFKGNLEQFPINIFDPAYKEAIPAYILELCFNLLRNGHFILKKEKIILLNCEGGNLKSASELLKSKTLSELEHLYLKRNNIELIEGLEHLYKLKVLNLHSNNIKKIENLDELENLEELVLSNNKIEVIDNLISIKNLKKLSLNNNLIKDITGLEDLPNLKELYLNNNMISRINGLDNLINLTKLNISNNNIEQIFGLENLENLERLYLNNNKITRIDNLDSLCELKVLNLSNNKIKRINGLRNLIKLRKLELSQNKIYQIEGLDTLINMQELFLDKNNIENLKGLDNLRSLIILFLESNKISEFKIENIKSLCNLNYIFLNENPLTPESQEFYRRWSRFP